MTMFGVPWEEVALEHVQELLAEGEPEPLLWEAKGGAADRSHVIKTVGAFANTHDGGYLILGAEETDAGWQLPGIELPDEPPTWISNIVADNLRPTPRFDVRPLRTTGNRWVVLVRVDPLAAGPCIARGTVYERLPGRSAAVREPLRLAELYRRGDSARGAALAGSRAVCGALLENVDLNASSFKLAIGLAAVAYAPDIASRLFTEETEAAIVEAVEGLPGFVNPLGSGVEPPEWWQDAITAEHRSRIPVPSRWRLRAQWSGAVGALYEVDATWVEIDSVTTGIVRPAWVTLAALVEHLGGSGAAFLTLRVAGAGFVDLEQVPMGAYLKVLPTLTRGPLALVPDDAHLAGIGRELARVRGERAPES